MDLQPVEVYIFHTYIYLFITTLLFLMYNNISIKKRALNIKFSNLSIYKNPTNTFYGGFRQRIMLY